MRSTMPILLSLALSLASSSALADMAGLSDEEKNVQEQIKKLINGVREKNRAAILSTISRQYKQSSPNGRSAPQSSTGMRVSPASGSSVAAQPPIRDGLAAFLAQNRKDSSFQQSNCQGFGILLRQDWKDMGYGSCPDTVDKATGAQLAYSNDRIVNNSVWSLHGTAAVLYSAEVPNKPDEYDLYHRSLGAYVTVNRLMNSAISQAKSNVDTLAYGGVVLFALSTPVDVGWTHWFRVRGGGVEDDLKNTTAANVTGEWSPVNPNWYVHYPFPFRPFGISMRFDPELIAQYDEVTGKKQILQFNNRQESLRLGPQLSLKLLPPSEAPDFVARFNASVVYHWAYEIYSRKPLNWFQSSVTYNLDQYGYIGLTASYQRGHDENTGANTNLYKLALTGKI